MGYNIYKKDICFITERRMKGEKMLYTNKVEKDGKVIAGAQAYPFVIFNKRDISTGYSINSTPYKKEPSKSEIQVKKIHENKTTFSFNLDGTILDLKINDVPEILRILADVLEKGTWGFFVEEEEDEEAILNRALKVENEKEGK